MHFLSILLQASNPLSQFLPLVLVGLVVYFFMIRPQQKRTKDMKKFRESIEKGTKVVTIGGIHGKVIEVKDTTILLEVEGGNKLKVEKSAISMDYTMGTGTSDLQQGTAAQK